MRRPVLQGRAPGVHETHWDPSGLGGTEGTWPTMPGTDGFLGGSVQRPQTEAVWDIVEVGAKWGGPVMRPVDSLRGSGRGF